MKRQNKFIFTDHFWRVVSSIKTKSAAMSLILLALVFNLFHAEQTNAQDFSLVKTLSSDDLSFGISVDIDGDFAVVGSSSYFEGITTSVFRYENGIWVKESTLVPEDYDDYYECGDPGYYGWSVSISGETAVVGCPYLGPPPSGPGEGVAYVFKRDNAGLWNQQAKLTAADGTISNFFGWDVDIDSNRIIVGAPERFYKGPGAAYVFTNTSNGWLETSKFTKSGTTYNADGFGISVAISGDKAIVGSFPENDNQINSGGSATVYSYNGIYWAKQQELIPASMPNDDLGFDVDLDGNTAIVSSYKQIYQEPNPLSKAVYVFTEIGGTWTEKVKLTDPYNLPDFHFGISTSIDNNTVVVGATSSYGTSTENGRVYVFSRSPYSKIWFMKQTVSNNSADETFGRAVGLNGKNLIVGSMGHINGDSKGIAFIFNNTPPLYKPRTLYYPKFRVILDTDWFPDLLVYREGIWQMKLSDGGEESFDLGNRNSIPVPADFDGDAITDATVFEDGRWSIRQSREEFTTVSFGEAGDIPVAGYFDADEKADFAVFRNGTWHLRQSLDGDRYVRLGNESSQPFAGDYDGDGLFDLSVYQDGTWEWLSSKTGRVETVRLGQRGDLPVAEDFDGDDIADPGVFRQGLWIIQQSSQGYATFEFGGFGDTPVPSDYDADGTADMAVYQNGMWKIRQSSAGYAEVEFGEEGDVPLSGQ